MLKIIDGEESQEIVRRFLDDFLFISTIKECFQHIEGLM